ncbi:uncharacterized protein LOC110455018 isoform X2 [Mizuhopecten yessoensis]|uniref:uncharacterized protein LOC110455018 isoform X2 n=1 Tax=Mizuhopecten yessoensis TaxID=6573 RepID=UPI000B45933D|nr:uncharacterized protein LOC110455018 isoform X2 [Mizuhopecten yessoensis]
MSGPSSTVGRVDRLTSQVEDDAMPDACGRPPPFMNSPDWRTETGGNSSPCPSTKGESVLRGTGQVHETSEGSSGGSEQIPSGRSQDYSPHIPPPGSQINDLFEKFMENYSFHHRYSSSEIKVFRQRLQIVKKHFERLPDEFKAAYYDVMVLYSEDDRAEAESLCQSLKDLSLENGKRVKAILYDAMDFANAKRRMFGSLEVAFERCTFAFVYLTKQFCKCEWSQIASEECLMEAIYNKDKRWCVVPVYTVQRTKADFRIPMGLNSLKGVNFYNNDDFYRRGLQSLIGGKIHKREDNEEKLFIEQYKHALEWEEKVKMETQRRQKKLEEAEHPKSYPPSSSSRIEGSRLHQMSYDQESSELLENLDKQMQSDVDSGVFTAGQFPPKTDLNRSLSNFQSESSASGYPSGSRSWGPEGDQSDSFMSYSMDEQKSVTTDISQGSNDSSLQADMAFSQQIPRMQLGMHGKEAVAKTYLSESEMFDEATGGKPDLDKDGKVVVHHIHTHTHIYPDKKSEKSKKSVVNIYGAENVVIGDHNTVVEGGTPLNPAPSDNGPGAGANSRKKPNCDRGESPSMSSPKSMEGASRPSMEGPNRPSMEGASRQSIDGHPSSMPSEIHNTTTKMPGSPNEEFNIEGNLMDTREKTEMSVSSNRQTSTGASKTYYNPGTAEKAPASFPSTKVAASVPSTKVAACVPSTKVAASVPSTIVAATAQSTDVAPNIPSANVAVNIPSKKVGENTGNSTRSMENVSSTTSFAVNCASTVSVSNTNSEHTQPGPNISSASGTGLVPASNVKKTTPKPKRDNPTVNLPKRPIVFSVKSAKPQAMATVMPLQNQQTTSSSDIEFRNDFGHSLASSQCQRNNQTEQKEIFQGHNTHVKTPVSRDSEDEDETEVKQVASVSPQNHMDVEPDCQNENETFLKSYSRAGLTDTDHDDQAVSKVLEMGFPEMEIKAALTSLQSCAPDGPSDAGFVLLTEESSIQNRDGGHQGSNLPANYASRHNRGSPNPKDFPRYNASSPNSASPSKDKDKCTIS